VARVRRSLGICGAWDGDNHGVSPSERLEEMGRGRLPQQHNSGWKRTFIVDFVGFF